MWSIDGSPGSDNTPEHASGEDDVQEWDVFRRGAHYHWSKQGTWVLITL